MHRRAALFAGFVLAACSSNVPGPDGAVPVDATGRDSSAPDADPDVVTSSPDAVDVPPTSDDGPAADADPSACTVSGAAGQCLTVTACSMLAQHSAYPGHCAGPADIQCCVRTPSTADNPPVPAGYRLMTQSQVTAEMTAWAVMILRDPVTYPMFSTATQTFGAQPVLARVEWHPPDFQNSAIHRGVTLYVPTG